MLTHALPRPAGTAWLLKGGGGLVVEDRQRPAPAGQFTSDSHVGDDGLLLAGEEGLPPLVQSVVAGVAAGLGRWRGEVPAGPHGRAGVAVVAAVVPGRFYQEPSGVGVAGLGDRALRALLA